MKKRLLGLGVAAAVVALLLAGCSKGSSDADKGTKSKDDKVKISFAWWGGDTRHKLYIKAIKEFEKENPNIKVSYEYAAWDDYWKKLATKSAAGELPDVVQMDGAYLAQYGEKNLLLDMSDSVGKGKTIDTTNLSDSIVNSGKIGKKVYAMAPTMTAMSALYNKSVLDEAGLNPNFDKYSYEDYVEMLQQVKKKTGKYGYVDLVDNYVLFEYYLRTQGEELYKYNSKGKPQIAFTKKTALKYFQSVYDLAKTGAIPTAEVAANLSSASEGPFAKGDDAFYTTWVNQLAVQQDSAADGVNFSVALPYGATSDSKPLYYRPAFYYSVSKTSKEQKAAMKLVDFFINSEKGGKIIGTERGIPANSKVIKEVKSQMTDADKKAAQYLDDIKDYVGEASPVPPVGFSEVSQAVKDVYSELTYNTMTPKEAYADLVDKMETSFSENYE